jgi:RecA/RadA recombinase
MATKKPVAKKVAVKKAPAKKAMEIIIKDSPVKRGRAKAKPVADDVEEAIEEAVGAKRKGKAAADAPRFDPTLFYSSTIDAISRKQGVDSDLMEEVKPLSTGNLMLDIVYGGGIRPAMMTHAGWEQSCKTTGALTIMASAIKAKIPINSLWDFEGSTANSKKYVANILRTAGLKVSVDDVFGKKDPATGNWIIPPMVRYHSETLGEKFFDWLSETLRQLPDKKFVANKWWLIYEDNKVNKTKFADYAVASMAKKYGNGIWIEAPDGNMQGLVIVDSYPAMNPTANDEEDANNSLGLAARMFAKHLPRVKGRLAKKMVALLGINQMRDIPMAMYGPKEQEPGGKALRFNSDIRIKWLARSSGMPFNPKFDTEVNREVESSVTLEGKDRYRYIQVHAFKNKLANPNRKAWIRLWEQDAAGDARGFDPFFDTACYLRETGQLTGAKRIKMELNLNGFGTAKKSISWVTLKTWVLGTKEEKTQICSALGYKPMDLRMYCFKQMGDGRGEAMYVAHMNSKTKVAAEEDE